MARLIPSPAVGHHPGDEISALLAAARARHYGEFRASFIEFGVPGQNLLCAGSRGTSSRFSLRPSRRGRRRAITTNCAIPRTRAPTGWGSSGRLDTWDDDYRPDSAAAATFEILLYYLVPALYTDGRRQASALLGQWGFLTKYLIPDLEALPPTRRARLLRHVLRKTARRAGRYAVWGDMHRLGAAHWLGRLPVLGKAFRLARFPVGGSRETPMKTAHGLVAAPHDAVYGSQARHISDLSDLDENYFVLFGGQDGWLGSANFADQIGLWRQGSYIRMPLRAESIAAEFPLSMDLEPAP